MPVRDADDRRRATRGRLPRVRAMLALMLVSALAIVFSGCSSGRSERLGHAPARGATGASPLPRAGERLVGKFTAGPIVVASPRLGLVTIGGFVGTDTDT